VELCVTLSKGLVPGRRKQELAGAKGGGGSGLKESGRGGEVEETGAPKSLNFSGPVRMERETMLKLRMTGSTRTNVGRLTSREKKPHNFLCSWGNDGKELKKENPNHKKKKKTKKNKKKKQKKIQVYKICWAGKE